METVTNAPYPHSSCQAWQTGGAQVTLLRIPDAGESDLSPLVTPDELARAARFHFAADRRRWLHSRVLLRTGLGAVLACAPGEVPLEVAPGGKPFVPGGPQFNLSHSGSFAALIIGDARPVGVDVEAAGRQADVLRIAERFFVRHECDALHAASDAERDPLFLRLWTAKEALMKATGLGMRLPPDRISVQLDSGLPVSVIRTDSGETWPLHCRELADCVVCAVEL